MSGNDFSAAEDRERIEAPGILADDLLWGCAAIAAELGVTQRRCFYMLESRMIPARKIGSTWCGSRRELREHFSRAANLGFGERE